MTSENSGAQEDLTLESVDADKVVGGRMWHKTRKTRKTPAAHAASVSAPLGPTAGDPGTGGDFSLSDNTGSNEFGGS